MLKVGLTGGIGSGKTTVCKIFETLGIPVYYADPRAKWLMNHNRRLKKSIKEVLGNEAYHRNGRLNRKLIASKIFNNKTLLKKVNELVHPAVNIDAQNWFNALSDIPYALYEAALLVENGSYKNFDKLIVVTAPTDLRIERVASRDKVDHSKVVERIKNQLPQEQKDALADFLIQNDKEHSLIQQVVKIDNIIKSLKII